jgi:hypothetical protein
MGDEKKADKVTSYFQSGGITAHTVNIGAQARHVDDRLRAELRRMIPHGSKVEIEVVMGDSEALKFAHEITAFLDVEGRPVGTFAQSMFTGPMIGQQCKQRPDGSFHILIGSHP